MWEDHSPGAGRPQELINVDADEAELFIGCLWKTMGTSASEDGRTGFEEEFDRANNRRKGAGLPEMSLFFKRVDPSELKNAGPKLQRVIAFRERIFAGREFLGKEFRDANEWREETRMLVTQKILALVSSKVAQPTLSESASTGQSQSDLTGGDPTQQDSLTPALKSLADLVKDAAARIKAVRSSIVAADDLSSARLLLFAATNYDWKSQHIELGTHEMNSLFLHRQKIKIAEHERLLLLRTVLLDLFDTKPGWFWIRDWSVKPRIWIAYFATRDSDSRMREAATKLASQIHLKWGKTGAKLISGVLADREANVRIAALDFLGENGSIADMPDITPLLADPVANVVSRAKHARWQILVHSDPEDALKKVIGSHEPITAEMAIALGRQVAKLSTATLRLAASHANQALREIAAAELLNRDAIDKRLAQAFCNDRSAIVKEKGFLALAKQKESIDLAAMRKDMEGFALLSNPSVKPNIGRVIETVFQNFDDEALWQMVERFDENAHLALNVLGCRAFPKFQERIRTQLRTRFEEFAQAARARISSDTSAATSLMKTMWPSYEPTQQLRNKLLIAALELIAQNVISDDRDLVLQFLGGETSDYEVICAALKSLKKIGHAGDREQIKPFLTSKAAVLQSAAIQTYLALSRDMAEGASEVLVASGAKTPLEVLEVIKSALERKETNIWPVLQPLLRDENDDIRHLAAFYGSCVLTRRQLTQCLDRYLRQAPYYYNVVRFFDRRLYGPKILSDLWGAEETEYQQKIAAGERSSTVVPWLE